VRRPLLWFLWPAQDPGPLDGHAVQARWIRVCPRGPWRWAFLVIMSATVAMIASAALAAGLANPGWWTITLSLLIILPLLALLARAWVAGTYVCDRGVKVSSVLSTDVLPWTAIESISLRDSTRLLGTPLRLRGRCIVLTGPGIALPTHVETASPDLWLRPQAWAAASDRLGTWHREVPRP
jgi:hypothetical protein